MKGIVKSVELSRKIDIEEMIDECIVTIGLDDIYAYYSYNDLLKFLGEEVSYAVRTDMVNGRKALVLCNIAEINHISVVENDAKDVKLYVDDNTRPYCNFSVKELKQGEFYNNSIAYLSAVEEGSSSPTIHWFDLLCLDRESRSFKLRIFADVELSGVNQRDDLLGAVGKYIQFDLRLTPYGMQTKEVQILPWEGGSMSPEVSLAKSVLLKALDEDADLKAYVESKNLIEKIAGKIDGEPGYGLVRMAAELYLINQVGNISADVDVNVLRRAVFCSRVYITATTAKWSKSVFNMNHILRAPKLSNDRELLLILDVLSEEPPTPTKLAYIKVKQLVDFLVKVRRGEKYEEEFLSNCAAVVSQFGGLL